MRLVCKTLQYRRRQPRLTDPRLTGKQHHLAFASLCLRPAPQQQLEFFFAPDEFSQCASVQSVEPALHGRWTYCRPGSRGPGYALEVMRSEVLKLKKIADELPRTLGYTTAFGSAVPCNRAARFGVSPTMACS